MEINLKNIQNTNLNNQNKNIFFDIKISLEDDKLYFNYINKNNNSFQQKIFILEELQLISNIFSIYDNINEIFDSIKDIISNSKFYNLNPNIIINEKETYFIIYSNLGKYKNIKFPLNSNFEKNIIKIDEKFLNQIEEDVKMFDTFIDLYDKNKNEIINLKNENENLKLKIENIYKQIFINKNTNFNNINNPNENYILLQAKYYNNKINDLFILEKRSLIYDWIISSNYEFKDTKFNFLLIYKAKIDGDKALNFHRYVDGKGPLIILVKTSTNKIIGGYTSIPWSSCNQIIYDSYAFLFSLTTEIKYDIFKPKFACYHSQNNGPVFGDNCELQIVDNCFKEHSITNCDSNNYTFFDNKNLVDEGGISTFQVLDYEVYQLIFYK